MHVNQQGPEQTPEFLEGTFRLGSFESTGPFPTKDSRALHLQASPSWLTILAPHSLWSRIAYSWLQIHPTSGPTSTTVKVSLGPQKKLEPLTPGVSALHPLGQLNTVLLDVAASSFTDSPSPQLIPTSYNGLGLLGF